MNLGRIGIVVSARTASTRLPNKALLPLGQKPMVLFLLERLNGSNYGPVLLATTTLTSDDYLAELVSSKGFTVFRGSSDDLIQRHYDLARVHNFDTLVRITADCPFMNAELVDHCLYMANSINYFELATTKGTFPIGLDLEIFPTSVLDKLHLNDYLSVEDREHLTLHLYNGTFRVFNFEVPIDWPLTNQKFTVDTESDYKFAQQVVASMNCENFSINELLRLV